MLHGKNIAQVLQTVNVIFLELVNDPEVLIEFPVTPGYASLEFTSDFIRKYNSFPGYEIKTFYRVVPLEADEREVSNLLHKQ